MANVSHIVAAHHMTTRRDVAAMVPPRYQPYPARYDAVAERVSRVNTRWDNFVHACFTLLCMVLA